MKHKSGFQKIGNEGFDISYDLKPLQHLKIYVCEHGQLSVRLLCGTAELFGTELERNFCHEFWTQSSFLIFTWHGCRIHLRGKETTHFISERASMVEYLTLHHKLTNRRNVARQTNTSGPRVMILGGKHVGKTTLGRILSNYASRQNRLFPHIESNFETFVPLFLQLDPGRLNATIPGTLEITQMNDPTDIHGNNGDNPKCIFHFGSESLDGKLDSYYDLVKYISSVIELKFSLNFIVKSSGCLINCPGEFKRKNFIFMQRIIDMLKITTIIVMGDEPLFSELLKYYKTLEVINLFPAIGIESAFYLQSCITLEAKMAQLLSNSFIDVPLNRVKLYCLDLTHEYGIRKAPTLNTPIVNLLLSITHTSDVSRALKCSLKGLAVITNISVQHKNMDIMTTFKDETFLNNIILLSSVTVEIH